MNVSSEFDVFDVVAGDNGPQLQAFRSSNPFEDSYEAPAMPKDDRPQDAANQLPLQLLRRASETVTACILTDLEPEKEHLLGPNKERPQPPPRSHGQSSFKGQQISVPVLPEAKRSRQQQKQQKADNMTQEQGRNGNTAPQDTLSGNSGPPLHTKLDIQKFPEDYNKARTDGNGTGAGGDASAPQNAATIILTPTSLNSTNTTQQNVAGNNGGALPVPVPVPIPGGGVQSEEYKGPKWWRHLVLHWSLISEHVALLVIFLGLWAMAWILLREFSAPQTVIMRIAFLFVGAQLSGILVTFVHLPDMLGMLFFGVLYANLGLANFEGYQGFELFLREMALINIMLLAGLGLDGEAFKRLWLMILRLTLLPTIAEVAAIAVLAYLTLSMPWLWGITLGLVITAISPNVVVTVMLKLKEDRLGLNSGIHTLIYAMTTCNDVVSIFMFGVIISVIFSTTSLTQQVLQGPIGIGIGLVFGYLYGMMLQFLPSRNATYANGLRFVLTILGGTIAVMGSRVIGYTSAGALGCVMTAFIARIGWRREESKLTPHQLQAHQIASVPKRLDLLWKFLKPVSFALIGKEINFNVLQGHVIGYGALLVLVGSLFRLGFAYLSTYGGNLSRKERAYITISGFPKATVQAALGPVALDLARAASVANEAQLALAGNVLIISVLAIIFTAPLGAILMLRLAPHWLKHGDAVEEAATTPTLPEAPANAYKRT
ncbi:sodium/hydrogen exchanger 9B1 isoform X1 [Drosophila pseudoobscura]|uniref:Sodium/hydrogen exchanger 9B1 isoform X1 n=2 Tax=Drosophila pseudoobscura pseudoobscura TaxID=46245 RepID=A0A6I8VD15_DROPS|nr:sodium/hydrogen exchanger 9B1 isoform X1 [Drosophila pseudoobscura]